MSNEALKEKTRALTTEANSREDMLKKLILEGFFDTPVLSKDVVTRVREKFGKKWRTISIQTYLRKFIKAEIIHSVRAKGSRGNYWVLSSVSKNEALKRIGKDTKTQQIESALFDPTLTKQLEKDFSKELDELHNNFGTNGNCTAFLLRKILEKLIIIVLSKNKKGGLLADKNRLGGWTGLQAMIEIASREKLNGIAFLTGKTAQEIKGIKFLGDTAAHNPLVSVDMATILPQMPYIVIAYGELARRL
jgi:predicted transcriptional regulator